MNKKSILQNIFVGLLFVCLTAGAAFAQTTAFTYQGKLTDAGMPQATYQMRFELYDALAGGNQVGATQTNPAVAVTNGIFTVPLDFGTTAFDGTDRFLEIAVKRSAGDVFTVLTPRQPITSAPYSLQSLNSGLFDSLPSSRFVQFDSVGNVGIGIAPRAGIKLDVAGTVLISPVGAGVMQFGNPNGETGMTTIVGTGRADMRFDGTTLKLVAGLVGGPPPSSNGITISTAGKVVIGEFSERNAKLYVEGGNGIGLEVNNNTINTNGLYTIGGLNSGSGVGIYGRGGTGVNGTGSAYGVFSDGFLGVNILETGGNTPLCRGVFNRVATCSSSYRYKKDFQPFGDGLSFINQLRPIAYKWKADNLPDIGFGAEDVAKINPLFVTYNDKGEVEGVKYDRLSVVFVNAFKEQQTQIEEQQIQIKNLKALICLDHPNADVCQEK